jgi:hypothetical protein
MPVPFDPGYSQEPFRTLVQDVPDTSVFPTKDFRTEWGPVFHRGRLDGSARLLVVGQDPAQHEVIARRTLVGGAGHRIQGFIEKLGLTRSYVMVNTFIYSVYGQGGGNRHKNNAAIAAYRNRWFDALLPGSIQGVVALGQLADFAWQQWRATPTGAAFTGTYVPITHPTQPESSAHGNRAGCCHYEDAPRVECRARLLKPVITPDVARPLVRYGTAFTPAELPDIPQQDFPAGSPAWMCGSADWARRTGADDKTKRVTITVRVPKAFWP